MPTVPTRLTLAVVSLIRPRSLGSTNKRYEPSELRFYFTLAGDAIAQLIVIPAKRP
jgi:hypothetical protein